MNYSLSRIKLIRNTSFNLSVQVQVLTLLLEDSLVSLTASLLSPFEQHISCALQNLRFQDSKDMDQTFMFFTSSIYQNKLKLRFKINILNIFYSDQAGLEDWSIIPQSSERTWLQYLRLIILHQEYLKNKNTPTYNSKISVPIDNLLLPLPLYNSCSGPNYASVINSVIQL